MPYLPTELKFRRSKATTNTPINGGWMINQEYISAKSADVFPIPSDADMSMGVIYYRKVHCHLAKSDNSVGLEVFVWLKDFTPAETASYFFAGTHRDAQGDITGSERKYGVGRLHADAIAGSTTLVVDFELGMGALAVIQAGDKIVLTNLAAERQFLTVSAVAWTVDRATITTTETIATDFLTLAGATCASVWATEQVTTRQDGWQTNSVAGIYNSVTYPLLLNHLGCVEQILTFIFAPGSSTTFSCLSDVFGNLGTGTINNDFAPSNPNTSTPYFVLRAAGFSGLWAAGESFSVSTHPAAVPVWWAYKIPATVTPAGEDGATLILGVRG